MSTMINLNAPGLIVTNRRQSILIEWFECKICTCERK